MRAGALLFAGCVLTSPVISTVGLAEPATVSIATVTKVASFINWAYQQGLSWQKSQGGGFRSWRASVPFWVGNMTDQPVTFSVESASCANWRVTLQAGAHQEIRCNKHGNGDNWYNVRWNGGASRVDAKDTAMFTSDAAGRLMLSDMSESVASQRSQPASTIDTSQFSGNKEPRKIYVKGSCRAELYFAYLDDKAKFQIEKLKDGISRNVPMPIILSGTGGRQAESIQPHVYAHAESINGASATFKSSNAKASDVILDISWAGGPILLGEPDPPTRYARFTQLSAKPVEPGILSSVYPAWEVDLSC